MEIQLLTVWLYSGLKEIALLTIMNEDVNRSLFYIGYGNKKFNLQILFFDVIRSY